MEPDVIRMYSSSPPPMEDGAEDDEDEFGDFGTFSGVPSSISFSELDTPTTFNQSQALSATSPPELLASRGLGPELPRVNGVVLGGDPSSRTEGAKVVSCSLECSIKADCNDVGSGVLTNGFESFDHQGTPPPRDPAPSSGEGLPLEDTGSPPAGSPENDFADFAAFSDDGPFQVEDSPAGGHLQVGATCQNRQNEQGGAPEDTDGDGSKPEPDLGCPAEVPTGPPQEDPPSSDPHAVNGVEGTSEGGTEQTENRVSPDETETSLGRPLSTNALEEYADMSTTCSAPSPPVQGDTPTDSSLLAEDDVDFGDFGDHGSFTPQGLAEFEPSEVERDDDFGDFNSPKFQSPHDSSAGGGSSFPISDSFGYFSLAQGRDAGAGWSAFGKPEEVEGETWAEFSAEPTDTEMQSQKQTDKHSAPPTSRLESLFLSCFPAAAMQLLEQQVDVLMDLLDTTDPRPEPGPGSQEEGADCRRCGVWTRLRDVHEALGLRYQWGGSYCNKALLGCLGIDTRNILFTGQKKQPVIVPMYAAGLGMLEPTKEPVKPVSAAEMITSIGQVPVEDAPCPPDSVQEALPPIQFDWSSSGLTNPLDGVDPELFELTTSKLDPGSSSSRVVDAFARLMSTVEKTSTSTRKPKKDENLSPEAAKVIAALPDLSFMHAKVLMFPATLMPLCSQATPD